MFEAVADNAGNDDPHLRQVIQIAVIMCGAAFLHVTVRMSLVEPLIGRMVSTDKHGPEPL